MAESGPRSTCNRAPCRLSPLYTTIFPGVERVLDRLGIGRVRQQTDQDFQLWIGLDAMAIEAAKKAIGGDPDAVWVQGVPGDTPAQVRQRAFERIMESCDAVVLVDSDDVLHRLAWPPPASMLNESELVGCALRLVDEQGHAYGLDLRVAAADRIPRTCFRGTTFSASRTRLSVRTCSAAACLSRRPLRSWTGSWPPGRGSSEPRMAFNRRVEMDYRQHDANMARIVPPFDQHQVAAGHRAGRQHFRMLRDLRSKACYHRSRWPRGEGGDRGRGLPSAGRSATTSDLSATCKL